MQTMNNSTQAGLAYVRDEKRAKTSKQLMLLSSRPIRYLKRIKKRKAARLNAHSLPL